MKTKLFKTLFPVIAASSVVTGMILPLSSCKDNKNDDKPTKAPSKLNMNALASQIDINSNAYPLSITINEPVTITLYKVGTPTAINSILYYRYSITDPIVGEKWSDITEFDFDQQHPESALIYLASATTIQIFGFNNTTHNVLSTKDNYVRFYMNSTYGTETCKITIGGNIASLICDEKPGATTGETIQVCDTMGGSYCFYNLFGPSIYYGETYVTNPYLASVGKGFLPFTTLTEGCYENLFWMCPSLAFAPELPAQTLAKNCYKGMFKECTSLQTAPVLPAKVLADGCYEEMFKGCSILNSINLTYVGNFTTTHFLNWVDGVSAKGKLYYNGVDDQVGSSYIPTNFTPVFNQTFRDENLKILTITANSTSTVTGKTKLAAYNDMTINDLETGKQLPTIAPKISGQTQYSWYYNSNEVDKTKPLSQIITSGTAAELVPSYGADTPISSAVFVNGGTIKYNRRNDGGKLQSKIQYKIIQQGQTAPDWTTLEGSADIDVPANSTVMFQSTSTKNWLNYDASNRHSIQILSKSGTADIHLAGSIMSFLPTVQEGDELARGCFVDLFAGSTGIKTIDENFLPHKKIPQCGYLRLFKGCTGLTETPLLPAEVVPDAYVDSSNTPFGAYESMFEGCTNLTKPRLISAKQIGSYGMYGMFMDCRNLKISTGSGNKLFFKCPSSYGNRAIGWMLEGTDPNGWKTRDGDSGAGKNWYYN